MAKRKITIAELKELTRNKSYIPQSAGLKQGDKGDEVKRLQDYLTRFGYLQTPSEDLPRSGKSATGTPSEQLGNFGKGTRQALIRFQRFYGLKPSGELDRATLGLMSQPRCGNPDIRPTAGRGRQSKFVLEGRKWNKTALTYSFQEFTPDLSRTQVRSALAQAFGLWSAVTPLTFSEVTSGADIVVRFAAGNHGDGSDVAFDGPGGVLAHGYYPPPNSGSLAGDLHFDEAETWSASLPPSGIDLVSVAAHEIGHALGLDHSGVSSALMFAIYSGAHRKVEDDDICGIRALYGNTKGLIFKPCASISFNNVVVGDLKISVLTITNNTNGSVTVSLPSSTQGVFRWNGLSGSIPPGEVRKVNVQFRPTGTGTVSKTLQISNSTANNPHVIKVSGRAIGGQIP
jgi:peptidoglycan hydrolase-like protein with peptidoglycan-binding domain